MDTGKWLKNERCNEERGDFVEEEMKKIKKKNTKKDLNLQKDIWFNSIIFAAVLVAASIATNSGDILTKLAAAILLIAAGLYYILYLNLKLTALKYNSNDKFEKIGRGWIGSLTHYLIAIGIYLLIINAIRKIIIFPLHTYPLIGISIIFIIFVLIYKILNKKLKN